MGRLLYNQLHVGLNLVPVMQLVDIPESNDEFDTILPTLNNEKILIDLGFNNQ